MDITNPNDQTRDSLAYCHKITRKRARNFYYGLKLTPEPKRSAGYALYAFMRACDDMADDPGAIDPSENQADKTRYLTGRIETFRQQMQSVLDNSKNGASQSDYPPGKFWPAFAYVQKTYQLKPEHLHAMLDGQQQDLVQNRYETFDQLYDYCYKVASVVGLTCIDIWGHDGASQVRQLAEHRGIALQLTNILRDLKEDASRGRVYLPQEDLDKFDYSEQDLIDGVQDERFDRLMRYEIERAHSYYVMSEPLEPHIDPSCRPTSWALMRIYRDLLYTIAQEPGQIFDTKVSLPVWSKMSIALQAAWKKPWRNQSK